MFICVYLHEPEVSLAIMKSPGGGRLETIGCATLISRLGRLFSEVFQCYASIIIREPGEASKINNGRNERPLSGSQTSTPVIFS